MRFFICASPKYIERHGKPNTPAEINQHNCLLFPRTGYDLNWLFRDKQGRVSEFRANGKYLITNSQSIRQCAQSGMGLALLPDWLISNELNFGSLVKLLTDYEVTATEFGSAVWMLHPSREYLPLKTRVFMDYLVDKLQSDN